MDPAYNTRLCRRTPLFLLLAVLFLTGCVSRSKPYDFPNSVWVNEATGACVVVTTPQSYSYGEVKVDDQVIPITMIYHFGNSGAIFDFCQAYSEETVWEPSFPDEKYLWAGDIAYAAKKFTLQKTDTGAFKKDGNYSLFTDDDLPLTFVRYDCTEEELLPLLPWDEEDHLKEGFEPGQLLEFGLSVAEENPKKDIGSSIADFWADLFRGTTEAPSVPANN